VWSLLALPLTLCLLVTGPSHIAFHDHGSTDACDHSHAEGQGARVAEAQAPDREPSATLHAGEASSAGECGLCLFAGAPLAGAPAHPESCTEPPCWAPGPPSACFGGDALELPAPRGPPALG
jgi:hypothetical protein